MGSFGVNKNKSSQSSYSATKFNTDFLDPFEGRYGTMPKVAEQLPGRQSIFTDQTNQQATDLGFGQRPETLQGPGPIGVERVNAPTLANAPMSQAATVQMPGGSLDAFERSAFRSQFAPVAREFDRTAVEQRGQLQGQVAGAGLMSSGAGIGLIQKQAREQSEQRGAMAADAADRAATMRGGFEQQAALVNQQAAQQTALANAEREQQTNLARAGFDAETQRFNAANVLQGNLANAQNYLATLGMNVEQGQQARDSYLALMGVRGADLERMDAGQRANVEMELNAYLQFLGQAINAGKVSKSDGSSKGVGVGLTAGGS